MCELSSFWLNRNKELHEQTGSRRMDRDTDGQAVRNICRGNDDESETCGWCVRLAKCHSDHLKVKHTESQKGRGNWWESRVSFSHLLQIRTRC